MEITAQLKKGRGTGISGLVCVLLTLANPALAVEGRGAAVNPAGLEASRKVDPLGLSAFRTTPLRTPSGFLYPYPLSPPSYRAWGDYEVRGFVDVGFLGDAGEDNGAQFRKYADWGEGFLLRSFELDLRKKEGLGYFSFAGGAAGRDDQFYRAELGQVGRFRVTGFFDSLSHRYADDARILLNGVGTEMLTLPGNLVPGASTLADVDTALMGVRSRRIEHERDDAGVDISIRSMPGLRLFANYRNQHHEGLRPFGGTLGFTLNRTDRGSVIETLEPLDSRTHHWAVGAEYAGEPFQANVAYRGSAFENDFDSLTWENPFFAAPAMPGEPRGRSSLAPDNHSHQVSGDVAARLPWNTRFMASGSFTRFRQNARLLAPTINTTLPEWINASTSLSRQHADSEVDQWTARTTFQIKPTRSLSVQLTGRYFERDDNTHYFALNPDNGETGYVVEDLNAIGRVGALGFSYRRWSVGSKASQRIGSKTRVGLEFEHKETIRENRSRHKVRDERLRLNLTTRALPYTNLRVAYEFLHRGGSSFDSTRDEDLYDDPNDPLPIGPAKGLATFRQFDLVSRDQHKVDLRANWLFSEVVDLSLAAHFREGGPDTSYGLTHERTARLDADASYLPSPKLDLRVFWSFEWRDRRLESIVGRGGGVASGDFTPGGPAYPLTNEWSLDSELWNFSVGAGGRYRPVKQLELRLNYTYLRSKEELEYDYASPSALPNAVDTASLPDHFQPLRFEDHVLDAQVWYQWTKWLESTLFYRLQRSTVKDFQQKDLQPRVNQNLLLAHTDDNYTAHVFGASIGIRF